MEAPLPLKGYQGVPPHCTSGDTAPPPRLWERGRVADGILQKWPQQYFSSHMLSQTLTLPPPPHPRLTTTKKGSVPSPLDTQTH